MTNTPLLAILVILLIATYVGILLFVVYRERARVLAMPQSAEQPSAQRVKLTNAERTRARERRLARRARRKLALAAET